MSTPSSKHAPPALPHPSSPEATPTNVAPSLPRTNVMRQDGAPSWELTLLVGHEPDLLLMNSDVFLPLFHDEWRPQEGPEHLLRQSSPSMIRVSHQRLTASEGEAIKDQIQKDMARITALNLVLDLLGMQVDHLVETMRAAGQLVAVLARSLTVLKIWIRTSCRLDLNKENEMRVFCDLEHPAVTNFFRVFELKQKDKGPLLSNLQHLWIEIREQYDRQLVDQEHELADLDLKLWKALPKQYLLDQTCLLEFVFHSTSRYIKFPPQVNTTNPHNFFFKLNDVSSPSKLLVEYRQQDLAQWAPYMAKMSLVPPYKLHELEPLWSQFSALTHLWIALPGKADEDLTFVQLIRSLGTSERGGKHLKMLQVEIWDSIINLTQARDYLQQKRLPPLPSIEVLTIVKHHFTHHDQVKLHESILTKLFPNVRIFSLWVKDDQCGECGEKTRNCVYDYAVLELAFWQYIQAWIVVLTNQFENLRLISTMPSEEVIQRKWFDFSVFHRETPLMDDDHQPEQHPEASPSAHTVTLMFGNSPELLLEDSHLFVLWHDRWRPDEGPEAAVLGVDKNLYKRRLTSEGCDAILGQLRGNSPTVLNLVIDLYGMTKEEVIVAMEVAKDLLSALARTLRVLKIWLRSSIRLRQGPKPVESTDLDLPAMSEFFKIFAQREDKGFLLRNVTHLWIDIHEELDHCLVAVGTTCDLKPVHWKQQALMAYLYTQTNLIEFAFNSTHRWIKFPSKSFSATKNLFNFLIFTEHSPAKLLVDYGPDGFARWANRVTMISKQMCLQVECIFNSFQYSTDSTVRALRAKCPLASVPVTCTPSHPQTEIAPNIFGYF